MTPVLKDSWSTKTSGKSAHNQVTFAWGGITAIITSIVAITGSVEIAWRSARASGIEALGKEKARMRFLPPTMTVAPAVSDPDVNENMKTPMSRNPM